jgi:hypothetical protein
MSDALPITFEVTVAGAAAHPRQAHAEARSLLQEIKGQARANASFASEPNTDPNTQAVEVVAISTILVSILSASVGPLATCVFNWLTRESSRKLSIRREMKHGEKVCIDAGSSTPIVEIERFFHAMTTGAGGSAQGLIVPPSRTSHR